MMVFRQYISYRKHDRHFVASSIDNNDDNDDDDDGDDMTLVSTVSHNDYYHKLCPKVI